MTAAMPAAAKTGDAGSNPLTRSQERIYSAHQLVSALKAGVAAVKEQLGVLSILDGTAASWSEGF